MSANQSKRAMQKQPQLCLTFEAFEDFFESMATVDPLLARKTLTAQGYTLSLSKGTKKQQSARAQHAVEAAERAATAAKAVQAAERQKAEKGQHRGGLSKTAWSPKRTRSNNADSGAGFGRPASAPASSKARQELSSNVVRKVSVARKPNNAKDRHPPAPDIWAWCVWLQPPLPPQGPGSSPRPNVVAMGNKNGKLRRGRDLEVQAEAAQGGVSVPASKVEAAAAAAAARRRKLLNKHAATTVPQQQQQLQQQQQQKKKSPPAHGQRQDADAMMSPRHATPPAAVGQPAW
jgi:hypothetical protein